MLDLHGISMEAFNRIVGYEVTSKALYLKRYRRPTWPGEKSGATIGIGYDVGQNSKEQLWADWKGKIPDVMIKALERACGVTGPAANALTQKLRTAVDVPWDAAIDVFSNHDVPRYLGICRRALPGFDGLPADCKGSILSLVFNRGASFTTMGDRYREMRGIKACMVRGDYAGIPAQLRSMSRLWPDSEGLQLRREDEAKLFEQGLRGQRASFMPQTDDPEASGDGDGDHATAPIADVDDDAPDPVALAQVQQRLRDLGYFEVGVPDGGVNGTKRTEAAILAFRNDHGMPLSTQVDDDLLAALAKAAPREISPARANATADDLRDQGSETIGFTDRMKRWAGRSFGAGSGIGVFGSMAVATEKIGTVTGLKDAVGGLGLSSTAVTVIIVAIVAGVVITGAGIAIWYAAHLIEQRRLADYRKGKNT